MILLLLHKNNVQHLKFIAMRRTLDDLSDEEYEDYEKHPEDYEDVTDATNEDVMNMMGELDDD